MKSTFETEIITQWFYYHFLKEWTLEGRMVGVDLGGVGNEYNQTIFGIHT